MFQVGDRVRIKANIVPDATIKNYPGWALEMHSYAGKETEIVEIAREVRAYLAGTPWVWHFDWLEWPTPKRKVILRR